MRQNTIYEYSPLQLSTLATPLYFMNAFYKETEKPFGYLLVDNKSNTPPHKQVLANLFGECYVYHFAVSSTEPTRVETNPADKH